MLSGFDTPTARREPPCAEAVGHSRASSSSFVAGACGGDDSGEALNADTFTPVTSARAAPPDPGEPDAPVDDEQQNTPIEPVLQIRLNNRFVWCAEVQSVWDAHDQARFALDVAEARYEEWLATYSAADDELDRAEARDALNDAERTLDESRRGYQRTLTDANRQLHYARSADRDSPRDIAFRRAWSALLSADPVVAALSEAVPEGSQGPVIAATTTTPLPFTRDSEILAEVIEHVHSHRGPERPGDSVWNPEAAEAALGVYSQADSALIAKALAAAALTGSRGGQPGVPPRDQPAWCPLRTTSPDGGRPVLPAGGGRLRSGVL